MRQFLLFQLVAVILVCAFIYGGPQSQKGNTMKEIKTKMTYSKETKNKFVFVNTDDGAPLSAIYVDRKAVGDKAPKTITVTMSSGKADKDGE